MKLLYLGTAAAEGQPALFCTCATCRTARERGGRDLRTRSQALLDGRLLLDFPPDTLAHTLREGIDLSEISDCLLTHTHTDHLYPDDFENRVCGYSKVGAHTFTLRGSAGALAYTEKRIAPYRERMCAFRTAPLALYETTAVGDFSVTALPALHDPASDPVIYLIGNGEGKHLLYAHDTAFFEDDVFHFLKERGVHLDLVSLDCTYGQTEITRGGGHHMNLEENRRVRERLLSLGTADGTTVFVSNHFSHNGKGVLYDEFSAVAQADGILMSYDGMAVEV